MTNARSADHVALRTPLPSVGKAIPAGQREASRGSPGRGRRIVWAILGLIAVALAGLGTIGARVQSNVGFKVTGVLAVLNADQGDRVKAGQVLAQLDARDVAAQVAVANAAVAQGRANIEKAEADITSATANVANTKAIASRRAALVKNGFATVEETQTADAAARVAAATLVSAQASADVAKAAVASAEAQLEFENAMLTNYTLYAPYDAWIVSRNLELGAAVNPGQSVFTLVEAHSVWALGYVDERLAGRLAVGQPAEIILRSEPGKRYPGHVARIEIQSDAVNEERLVDVAFNDIPPNIHLAEQAEIIVTAGTLAHAVTVLQTAISNLHDARGTVWTVEEGKLERRDVTFGHELLDGRLPILDGLPPDAAVVTTTVSGMRVGRAVRVAEGHAQ